MNWIEIDGRYVNLDNVFYIGDIEVRESKLKESIYYRFTINSIFRTQIHFHFNDHEEAEETLVRLLNKIKEKKVPLETPPKKEN